MMKYFATFLFLLFFSTTIQAQTFDPQKYIIEHEKDIAVEQPAPHRGGGNSVGYNFFKDAKDFKTTFRKRVLKPDAAIGYHQQKEDEIYYVVSGKGMMRLNEETYEVNSGDAILTRTGSSHSIKNMGKEDLVLIIVYEHQAKKPQ
jgi:mannose-6-phosphate isomerase-like protein (cupin superfamily)